MAATGPDAMADAYHGANLTPASIEHRVGPELIKHAIPDPRFHFDFSLFVPNFRGSSAAIDRVVSLPCYRSAKTVFVASDNSLEQLRFRALKDGKRLLVSTHGLRRGFVLLDPHRLSGDKYELASCLDGMEKPGIGRHVTLAQMQEEGITVDAFIFGSFAINLRGSPISYGLDLFQVQWFMLADRRISEQSTPVIAVVHECQIVDEAVNSGHHVVQCNFVITSERLIEFEQPKRPKPEIASFDMFPTEILDTVPPLQELRGIKMMEQIMKTGGFADEKPNLPANMPSADEQMGIDMIERIMKGYKA